MKLLATVFESDASIGLLLVFVPTDERSTGQFVFHDLEDVSPLIQEASSFLCVEVFFLFSV